MISPHVYNPINIIPVNYQVVPGDRVVLTSPWALTQADEPDDVAKAWSRVVFDLSDPAQGKFGIAQEVNSGMSSSQQAWAQRLVS
ncbi:MAG: hypothetical protein E6R03_15930 [Hyphomicrobiaceae bacterium]|nr:MAG: hypothetical protein E6R03_15930 [Hyphomicrobiaceae bacterium]